ncbi:MAG: hypothetical protein LBP93_00850, partial [Treponema sp.]|jgi:predicted transposase YbfD/YdcC|nr:hypothetical protein [Treponema sp.]
MITLIGVLANADEWSEIAAFAGAMHRVSAFSTERGLGLAAAGVEETSYEIPAVRDVLDITDIRGSIVTWDAMNTQKDTVRAVIAKKGDYAGALKGGPRTCLKTVDKEQSGVATREYYLTQDIGWLYHQEEWAGLKSIGCVKRTMEKFNGERTVEVRYFIASITDIEYFAKAERGHWQVENKQHWHLDWKAGVHTPSNLWFELASVKFTTTEKVVKPVFGPGYGPKNPLARGRVQSDQRSAISYPTEIPRGLPRGSSLYHWGRPEYDHEEERGAKPANDEAGGAGDSFTGTEGV